MSDIQLSKDADYLICLIYKRYIEMRNNGISKSDAKTIGDSHDAHENIVPEWSFEDTDDTCRELINKGLLDNRIYVDDICGYMSLSDDGIVYMENRLGNKISKIIDYISKLKP